MTERAALIAAALTLVGAACGKDNRGGSSTALVWKEFWGAEYQASAATRAEARDGWPPGPQGLGGQEPGVRPTLDLILPGVFYVQIVSAKNPTSLDGEERVVVGNRIGSNLVGRATPTGWELTYTRIGDDDASMGLVHTLYSDIAGRHFECTYTEQNCPNSAAADAVCRSLRPATSRRR